ncbi:MAG: DoxX family membrane protein [Acidobacteria bacterium]|nr:DoxX family membrane protein [Acidobacteriota bacterium]
MQSLDLAHLTAALSGAYAVVLVASGGAKLRSPDPTRTALAAFRLPASRRAAYALGFVEVTLGVMVLFVGAIPQLVGGALYLAFAVVVTPVVTGRLDLETCGCFGERSLAPGVAHIAINLVGAGSFFAMYVAASPPFVPMVRGTTVAAALGWTAGAVGYAIGVTVALTKGTMLTRGAEVR